MSFVRNFSDNQSPGDADSGASTTRAPRVKTDVTVVETFLKNFSDNQSPADADAPHAEIAAPPGTLGAKDAVTSTTVTFKTARTMEDAAQTMRGADRKVDEGLEKSYKATAQGVDRTFDAVGRRAGRDVTDFREGWRFERETGYSAE